MLLTVSTNSRCKTAPTNCMGGRHNMPRPLQAFNLESVVRVTCDVGYLCANFSLPRPLCSQLRPNVCDRQTSDAHHRLMPPTLGVGHSMSPVHVIRLVVHCDGEYSTCPQLLKLSCTQTQWQTVLGTRQWSNYGGARGGLAHLKDLAAPAKHLFWKGSRGHVKGPLKLQDDHPLFIDALLQFASVFYTEIAVEKHFDPLKCDFWRASKNFLRSLSLAMFYGPLINYAVIRPLPIVTMER